jgi:hypothetical protein
VHPMLTGRVQASALPRASHVVAVSHEARHHIYVQGTSIRMESASRFADIDPAVRIHVHLADATVKRFFREFEPLLTELSKKTDLPAHAFAPTDPRLLERLGSVSGAMELTLVDGGHLIASMAVAFGRAQCQRDRQDLKFDTTVAIERTLVPEIITGKLAPEEALGRVKEIRITGSRALALQCALAFAPFFAKGSR